MDNFNFELFKEICEVRAISGEERDLSSLLKKYYLENDILKQDSGYSIPFKFKVIKNDSGYRVVDSRIPRDGSYYSGDMKKIFPRSVRNDMNNVHTDGTIDELIMEVEEQVKLYFHK